MNREEMKDRLAERQTWDVIIIGGGASGVGSAVDAASRGYSTLLLEQCDFGKGTSSRSTKLAHGGVRYLQQGNISLVMEALKERGIMTQIMYPKLVPDQGAYETQPWRASDDMSVARSLVPLVLCLPMFAELTDAEVERVAAAIREFYGAD